MKKFLLPVIFLAGFNSFGQKNRQKTPIDYANIYAETITAAGLKEKLSVVASAEMEGRETATAGQRRAAAYIESHFRKIGLVPGTTAGYQMQFPVYQDTLTDLSLTVNGTARQIDKTFSLDINSTANGTYDIKEVVYASFGVYDSTRNDYQDLNVAGKWVLVIEGEPNATATPNAVSRRSVYSDAVKLEVARAMGAKGLFILSSGFPRKTATDRKSRMSLKKPASATVPLIEVSNDLAHELLGLNPTRLLEKIINVPTGDYKSNTQLTTYKRSLLLQSSNVIGVLPGTDKKDEYVVITGHYDHEGIRGNQIFYGADDDGSGTTAVMQIAEAYAKAAKEGQGPRRSIVFMTVSGEEKGLLGSEFYSEHPAFPLDKTVINLNIDMVGRIDPTYKGDSLNYVYVIGDDKLSSDLTPVTDSVNARYLKLQLDRRYNDLKDTNRFYYRSDHYNFARKGVPVIFYFNGTHADYHKPTDTVDKIKFDLMSKRVKLVFYTSWAFANKNEMVKRDIPLVK